jgi:hypothetical protein
MEVVMLKKLIVLISLLSLNTPLFPAAAAAVAAVYEPAPPLEPPASSSSCCVLSPRDLERANQSSLCPEDFAQARKVWAFLNIAVRDKRLLPIIAGYLPEPYTPNVTISTISAKTTRNWGCDTYCVKGRGKGTEDMAYPLKSMCQEDNLVWQQGQEHGNCHDILKCALDLEDYVILRRILELEDYVPTARGPNYSIVIPEERDPDDRIIKASHSIPLGPDYMRLTFAVCFDRHDYYTTCCRKGKLLYPRQLMFAVLNKKTGKLFHNGDSHYKPAIELFVNRAAPATDHLPTRIQGQPLNADLCADVTISPYLGDKSTQAQVRLYFPHGNSRTCAALKATVPSTAGLVAAKPSGRCIVS